MLSDKSFLAYPSGISVNLTGAMKFRFTYWVHDVSMLILTSLLSSWHHVDVILLSWHHVDVIFFAKRFSANVLERSCIELFLIEKLIKQRIFKSECSCRRKDYARTVILFCLFYSRIQAAFQSKKRPIFPIFIYFFPDLKILLGFIPKFKRHRMYPKVGYKITEEI